MQLRCRGVVGTIPSIVEYWVAATERILDFLNCTLEQKLKSMVSLRKDEAYCWWQSVVQGTQVERITWEYFQNAFRKKYIGMRYVEAYKLEFTKLKQGDKTMSKYEVELLRLSCYIQG